MKLSMMAACAENGVIGAGADIPWQAKGEQLLFKALTFNQWLLVGRTTFESMGKLPNRRYAVVSRTKAVAEDDSVVVFASIDEALEAMSQRTDHLMVAGGGQIYRQLLPHIDTLHLSVIQCRPEGDVSFPALPDFLHKVFEQQFHSNIDYRYQIWQRQSSVPGGV
ncbi:trimethoprim-resistant dihydrofolate reductase DfrA [Gilvimarinus sp. DA14]|uniref:trimethoprim-resistant dihydrofolate reductase DfrA n=1 Tax=Gilvimarinus sp. DA14 TaxID=2956798 RepID=UPI0020B67105|nr:trimethoprim-resistant dihydrofolate reductase DfrA [Gilvimarinus sp. DA14]UTF61052.1 trimethoprim-resistant dihydrofolate reductase DfrA [Gilvimarinus sp. DA14]